MKYETARKLKGVVDQIRKQYCEDLKSKEMRIRQRWVDGSCGRWVDGSCGRWVDGSCGRWVDGSCGRWVDGSCGR